MATRITLANAPDLEILVSTKDATRIRSLSPRLCYDGKSYSVVGRGHTRIARVVKGLAKGHGGRVVYRNNDLLNLTRSNLQVVGA